VSVVNSTDHSPRTKKNRPRSNGRCGGAGGLAGHQVAGGPSVPSLGVEPSWRPCLAQQGSQEHGSADFLSWLTLQRGRSPGSPNMSLLLDDQGGGGSDRGLEDLSRLRGLRHLLGSVAAPGRGNRLGMDGTAAGSAIAIAIVAIVAIAIVAAAIAAAAMEQAGEFVTTGVAAVIATTVAAIPAALPGMMAAAVAAAIAAIAAAMEEAAVAVAAGRFAAAIAAAMEQALELIQAGLAAAAAVIIAVVTAIRVTAGSHVTMGSHVTIGSHVTAGSRSDNRRGWSRRRSGRGLISARQPGRRYQQESSIHDRNLQR